MKNFLKTLPAFFMISASLWLISCKEKNEGSLRTAATDTLKLFAGNEYAAIDQSPMDISYFPKDYPQNKISGRGSGIPVARIIYSRPHKKGRLIFGDDVKSLCPYGKPWRLGANEATEVDFFEPVIISGKNVAAGRYILYCIPFPDKWVIALNSNLDSWGLQIDPAKDVLRTEVPVQIQQPTIEDFTIVFTAAPYGADILCTWDNVKILMPVNFSR
jgi:hypothetical protein